MKFANEKISDLYNLFSFFTVNEWVYEGKMIYELMSKMSEEEKREFNADPKSFSWVDGIARYAYGMENYVLKGDMTMPDKETTFILHKLPFRAFDDARRVFLEFDIKTKDPARIRWDTINSEYVRA